MAKVFKKLAGTTQSQFLITPASFTGPPTTGEHDKGEAHVDDQGDWWFCITSGTPGTWVKGLDLSLGVELNIGWMDTCARNANNQTNIWLRTSNGTPLNLAPFVVPTDCRIIGISASTSANETCDFEVYRNSDVRSGGVPSDANKLVELQFSAQNSGIMAASVDLDAGDEIGVFMRGFAINRPRCSLFYTRRY